MAVPKKKTSVSRKGKRRGGHTHKVQMRTPMTCPNCGDLTLLHHACPTCGQYKGKQILKVKAPKEADASAQG